MNDENEIESMMIQLQTVHHIKIFRLRFLNIFFRIFYIFFEQTSAIRILKRNISNQTY